MKILFWGSLVFFASFLLHLAVWKVRIPARQTKTILFILFGGLGASLAAFVLVPSFSLACFPVPSGPAELLATALFVSSFSLAYVITYSAVEADSPTLVMIKTVADAGARGLAREDFFAVLNDAVLVEPRIRDLLTDRMAVLEGGRYSLPKKGRLFAAVFTKYRALLRLGKGG